MNDIDILVDKTVEFAIDEATQKLNSEQKFQPFSFLINSDGGFTSVIPAVYDYYFDESVMVDSFKSFGNEKLMGTAEGFCICYTSSVSLKGGEAEVIVVFCKFKNDHLPLKTRIYYFPFTTSHGSVFIDFEASFASEA